MSVSSIVIGLGGSGKSVAYRMRKKFKEQNKFWKSNDNSESNFGPDGLYFFCIDTEDVPESSYTDVEFRKSGNLDEFYLATIDGENYSNYLNKTNIPPEIKKWLPIETLRKEKVGKPKDGAGQRRTLGRLIFFENMTKNRGIYDRLKDLIKIAGDKTKKNTESSTAQVDIYIVYSIAGGTGAGMFIDLGILCRKIAEQLSTEIKLIHYAFLPEVFINLCVNPPFPKANIDPIKANAYASLVDIEMMHAGSRKKSGLSFPIDYQDGHLAGQQDSQVIYRWPYQLGGEDGFWEITPGQRPWHAIHLVGSGRDNSLDKVYSQVAELINLSVDNSQSNFTKQLRILTSNDGAANADDPISSPIKTNNDVVIYDRQLYPIYTTIGISFIKYDREIWKAKAKNILTNYYIDNHLLRTSDRNLDSDAKIKETVNLGLWGKSSIPVMDEEYFRVLSLGATTPDKFFLDAQTFILGINKGIRERLEGQVSQLTGTSAEIKSAFTELMRNDVDTSSFSDYFDDTADEFFKEKVLPKLGAFYDSCITRFGLSLTNDKIIPESAAYFDQMAKRFDSRISNNQRPVQPDFSRMQDAEKLQFEGFRNEAIEITKQHLLEQCMAYVSSKIKDNVYSKCKSLFEKIKSVITPNANNKNLNFGNLLTTAIKQIRDACVDNEEIQLNQQPYYVEIGYELDDTNCIEMLWDTLKDMDGEGPRNKQLKAFTNENLGRYYSKITSDLSTKLWDIGKPFSDVRFDPREIETKKSFVNFFIELNGYGTLTNHNFSPESMVAHVKKTFKDVILNKLKTFGTNLGVNQIFIEKCGDDSEKRRKILELGAYSQPLFQPTKIIGVINQLALKEESTLLGLSSDNYSKQIESLVMGNIGTFKKLDSRPNDGGKSDRIFLVKSVRFVPAAFASDLDELKRAYNRITFNRDLLHFDPEYFRDRMIDISMVDQNLASNMEKNIKTVIFCIMTRIIFIGENEKLMTRYSIADTPILGSDLYEIVSLLSDDQAEARRTGKNVLLTHVNKLTGQKIAKEEIILRSQIGKTRLVNAIRLFKIRVILKLRQIKHSDADEGSYPLIKVLDEMLSEFAEFYGPTSTTNAVGLNLDKLYEKTDRNLGDINRIKSSELEYISLVEKDYDVLTSQLPIPVLREEEGFSLYS